WRSAHRGSRPYRHGDAPLGRCKRFGDGLDAGLTCADSWRLARSAIRPAFSIVSGHALHVPPGVTFNPIDSCRSAGRGARWDARVVSVLAANDVLARSVCRVHASRWLWCDGADGVDGIGLSQTDEVWAVRRGAPRWPVRDASGR